jgi:hypothetical protein
MTPTANTNEGRSDALKSRSPAKVRATFLISAKLFESLRDASHATAISLTDIAEKALAAELVDLQKKHRGGRPFKARPGSRG